MGKKGLHIIFYLLLLLVMVPALQMLFQIFDEKPLHGAFNEAEKPVFSKENWMKGIFQLKAENYLKDKAGFRNFFIRLQNQIDFSLFRQANAEGAVVGKDNQLFEYDYIRSWLALDYPGDYFAEKKFQRMKFIQEYLKREKNIDLIFVFEPGKASFYPEYLPERFTRQKKGPSTYDQFRQKAVDAGIDFIDLHQYFLQLKPGSKYPLFPKYGTHWSVYGMSFAADSILNLIKNRRGANLVEVKTDTIETSYIPRDTDDDVLKTMNLLFPLKGEKLAYPAFSFDTVHRGDKPMVLVIADSYYWNFFNTRIPKYVFGNEAFWYFNSLVYPDYYFKPTFTKDLNFKAEIEKQQVILVMITERFVHKGDWKFIDQLCGLYAPHFFHDPVYTNINNIMQVEEWYSDIISKSAKNGRPLEESLIDEGKFIYLKEDTAGYILNFGIEHYEKMIANDTAWFSAVQLKARKKNISDEEMLHADAIYMLEHSFPEIYAFGEKLRGHEAKLRADADNLDRIVKYAKVHYYDPEEYIRYQAWQNLKEDELNSTRQAILNTPDWLAHVKQKAEKKGITVEEMISVDAVYMFDQKLKKAGLSFNN